MARTPSVSRPLWRRAEPTVPLPADLLQIIFAALPFQSKVNCHRVCKSWNSLLRGSETLWGSVDLDVGRLCRKGQRSTTAAPDPLQLGLYEPVARWLKAHRVAQLNITCDCCENSNWCKGLHNNLAALLGSLKSAPVDLRVALKCDGRTHLFMVDLSRVLTLDLASRIVSLSLAGSASSSSMIALSHLKRLQDLSIELSVEHSIDQAALDAWAHLTGLQSLRLGQLSPWAAPEEQLLYSSLSFLQHATLPQLALPVVPEILTNLPQLQHLQRLELHGDGRRSHLSVPGTLSNLF
ncbi:hypothetical protein WJX73_001916 [Symbiochloris irregularis]|uniref:F-box domain-containing protein n=1 Tax=Symbiochloris irregularis TaxID=706552 RepID=A0AAW1PPZ7_9CHLO